jgi:hypothetical protein
VGKSTAQIGRRQNDKAFYVGDSEVYEKWAQAIASSHDLVSEGVTDYKRSRQSYKWAATTIQPALVVADKTLWVAGCSPPFSIACDRSIATLASWVTMRRAIYSFRAAEVRNILDFPTEFPEATVVTLETNYRSHPADPRRHQSHHWPLPQAPCEGTALGERQWPQAGSHHL